MTASVLKAAGYRTGLFTSPYLHRFNERMQINEKEIEDEALAEHATAVRKAFCGSPSADSSVRMRPSPGSPPNHAVELIYSKDSL